MELILNNGDYIPDGQGNVARAEGDDALLQRVLFRLTARRGMLPMLPDLGSNLYRLGQERPENRLSAARQYAAQALQSEGLTVEDVDLTDHGGGRMDLTVWLRGEGGALSATVTL